MARDYISDCSLLISGVLYLFLLIAPYKQAFGYVLRLYDSTTGMVEGGLNTSVERLTHVVDSSMKVREYEHKTGAVVF